jgi:hypothetical protein
MTYVLFGQEVSIDDLSQLSGLAKITVKRWLRKGATTEDIIQGRVSTTNCELATNMATSRLCREQQMILITGANGIASAHVVSDVGSTNRT